MSSIDRFRAKFPRGSALLPVIHYRSLRQSLEALDVARKSGADGVWLINQFDNTDPVDLLLCVQAARIDHADFWIGVNMLGVEVSQVFRRLRSEEHAPARVDGVWVDDAGVRTTAGDAWLKQVNAWRSGDLVPPTAPFDGLYFGGVGFKYTPTSGCSLDDLADLAETATHWVDVVTISGKRTGMAPAIARAGVVADACRGLAPVAIASGLSPENMPVFSPFADAFLVASSIETSPGVLDGARIRAMADVLAARTRPDTLPAPAKE